LKKYYLLLISLLIVLFFTACSYNKRITAPPENSATEVNKVTLTNPPEILITAGDKEIPYVAGLNQWNGAIYDREDTFQTILKKDSGIEVSYIQLGESIQIEFKGNPPDKLKLRDYILKEDGIPKYTGKEVNQIPVKLVGEKINFKLEVHMAAMLSSNSKDYEPGNTIRGFKLTCSWGENECEYGFIIQTDAKQ
jgi:hypothetical protein